MKKVLVLLVLCLVMVGLTNAQTSKMKLGVGVTVGLPMGTFGDVVSLGYGGAVQGEYELGDKLVGTLATGYLVYSGKDIGGFTAPNWSIIPIQVGAKYFFTPNLYGAAQLGLNLISFKVQVPSFNFTTGTVTYTEESQNESKFGFGVGAGYDLGSLDFSVRYTTYASDVSAIIFTALYKFAL
jgi:hypothetical protein